MMEAEHSAAAPAPPTGAAVEARPRARVPVRIRVAGALAGVLLVSGVAALVLWLPHAFSDAGRKPEASVPVAWQRPVVSEADLAQRTGVRLKQVSVTGGGGLLDVRFQVVDPDKAVAVHDAETPPAIIDEATGLVINQMLMDHRRSGTLKPAVTYYMVFENTANWVHRGSKVSVLLGDALVEHVVVK